MHPWPMLATPMLAAGAAGGIAALVSLKVRQRWLLVVGLVLLIAGHTLFSSMYWGLIDAEWFDRLTTGSSPALSAATGDPWGTAVARVKDGSITDSEFVLIVKGTTPGMYSSGRDYLSSWLRTGVLSTHLADLLVDTLIADWPAWNRGQNVGDEIAPAVLTSSAVSPKKREAFIAFMAVARTDPAVVVPRSWMGTVTTMMLEGKVTPTERKVWLEGLATPALHVVGVGATVRPGQLFLVDCAGLPSMDDSYPSYPWKSEAILVGDHFQVLKQIPGAWSRWIRDSHSAVLIAPDTRGTYELSADVSVALTRDDLYMHFGMNPHLRPRGLRLTELPDFRAVGKPTLQVKVSGEPLPAAPLVTDSQAMQTISKALSIDFGHGHAFRTATSNEVSLPVQLNPLPFSVSFDAFFVEGGKDYPMGWVHCVQGASAHWTLSAHNIQEGKDPSRLKLVPRPSILVKTPGVTSVYDGDPVEIEVMVVDYGER